MEHAPKKVVSKGEKLVFFQVSACMPFSHFFSSRIVPSIFLPKGSKKDKNTKEGTEFDLPLAILISYEIVIDCLFIFLMPLSFLMPHFFSRCRWKIWFHANSMQKFESKKTRPQAQQTTLRMGTWYTPYPNRNKNSTTTVIIPRTAYLLGIIFMNENEKSTISIIWGFICTRVDSTPQPMRPPHTRSNPVHPDRPPPSNRFRLCHLHFPPKFRPPPSHRKHFCIILVENITFLYFWPNYVFLHSTQI